VGLTGEAGTAIGIRLLELVHGTPVESHVVLCDCVRRARGVEPPAAQTVLRLADRTYDEWNQAAKISSGSFLTLGMVVAPCSPRSLRAIAIGYANTLIHRAADVTMKEGRPLDLIVPGPLEPAEAREAERLARVPGVRVLTVADPSPADALDDLLVGVLERFGVPVAQPV
jgi:4-hydroxy-3-polyprenylbenzoate decarboxylase